jgi:hypothetical protein
MIIPMMRRSAPKIILVAGLLLLMAGIGLMMLDHGSCPSNSPGCYHTLPDTNIYTVQVAYPVVALGIFMAGTGAVLTLYRSK